MEYKFQVGDRVALVAEDHGNHKLHDGSVGTVVGYWSSSIVSVEWDEWCNGHDCNGRAAYGHGWNVRVHSVAPLNMNEADEEVCLVDLDSLM